MTFVSKQRNVSVPEVEFRKKWNYSEMLSSVEFAKWFGWGVLVQHMLPMWEDLKEENMPHSCAVGILLCAVILCPSKWMPRTCALEC